jgi:hypothetical protein
MEPVSAAVEIDVPRQRAFDWIGDLSRRPSFTDHFVSDFHLTRIEPSGVGAGARFRFTAGLRPVWMDTMIEETEAPHRILERGRGGRVNRIPSTTVWELHEGPGSLTAVRVSYWTEPAHPADRAIEALVGSSMAYERAWREALRRLRGLLEADSMASSSVGVAGGNPHATGIP